MNLKIISKNNVGCVATLLLIILLSQSKILNFLIETTMGRSCLILFILFISYTNKILGIVSVLFIIILFNNSGIAFMEGFTQVDNIKDKKGLTNDHDTILATSSASTSRAAAEGFDMVSKERYMQRGMQSNQIPVNDFMRESKNVAPYEGGLSTNSFSTI